MSEGFGGTAVARALDLRLEGMEVVTDLGGVTVDVGVVTAMDIEPIEPADEAKADAELGRSISIFSVATLVRMGLGKQEVQVFETMVVVVHPISIGLVDEVMLPALVSPGIGLPKA